MSRIGVVGILTAAMLLTGCAHTAALQPAPAVRDPLADIRIAAIDVLIEQGIELLDAPDCVTEDDGTVGCTGSTVTGERVEARTETGDRTSLVVEVGSDEVFRGSIHEVLERAAEDGS